MATKQIDTIELVADSNKLFFLVHGYTGSPTDFHSLPELLQKECKANVKIMLLPGHGTQVEDLDSVSYEDLMLFMTR